jgi:hypothetical protein
MTFLNGIKPQTVSFDQCKQMILFIKEFLCLKVNFKAKEAVFNIFTLKKQIKDKIKNIKKIKNKHIKFLIKDFDNDIKKISKQKKFVKSVTSPGDFGLQNILSYKGKFSFFDFEHSGKDSIIKFLCDFLLHPQNINIQINKKIFIIKKLLKENIISKSDLLICIENLNFFYIRWSLIILNSIYKEKKDKKLKILNKKIKLINTLKKSKKILIKEIDEKLLR